ncbi:MAG: ABC transporter permease [Acidimicrobiia bacterium]|nr:ABC transporter permease [Acidimicrobiia bacterium]
MLLQTVFTKTIRDRWLGMAIAAATLVLFMFYAMAVYTDIDLSIYTDLPAGIRELMGIPEGADAASLSYNVMLGFMGAVTLTGLAISMGSASIAGEERTGTLGLLLSNRRSRTQVLVSKIGAMMLLTLAGAAVLLAAGHLAPIVLDVEIGETHINAMMLHLVVNALFYGFGAMVVGAWTGNRALASGVAVGVLIVSFFAVGLLPLVESLADLARLFPWYYFDGSEPLVNGVNWRHIAVLGGGCLLFTVIAVVTVNRRDLGGPAVGETLLDRLRAHPLTDQIFDRLAGNARVARPWAKTFSDHQGLLIITAATMFGMMGVLMGPMYEAIEADVAALSDQFPEAVLALAGGGDFSTPEGFYEVETFSLMAPIAIMIVTIVAGAGGLAGEESQRTMGLLLANPIRRSRLVLEQALAMTVYAVIVGVATFAGVIIGSVIAGVGLSVTGVAAASLLVTLLGLLFGMLALAVAAATGRMAAAVYGTIGIALAFHLLNSYLPLTDRFAGWARWTPNHYYLSTDPLVNGMSWSHGAVLAAATGVLLAAAVMLFERRDIRQG